MSNQMLAYTRYAARRGLYGRRTLGKTVSGTDLGRPDEVGGSRHSRNRLSTRSVWRPTGTDGAGFAGARSPVPNSNSASRVRRVCQKLSEMGS
jgi:hypothetical protein